MKAVAEFIGQALVPSFAGESANPLLGTWKLKSYVVTTDAGTRSTPYGAHPTGYLGYSADGRMYAIGSADGRIAPHAPAPPDEEQLTLYKTMFAYAGTYTVEAGKVTHHVEVSWNEVWNGTDQVRFYELKGKTLVITASGMDATSGIESHYALVWEKVESPADEVP